MFTEEIWSILLRDKHSVLFVKSFTSTKSLVAGFAQLHTMDAESDSENIAVRFSKSRSPKHPSKEDFDGLTGDVFMPLVAGDEFEEEEGKL